MKTMSAVRLFVLIVCSTSGAILLTPVCFGQGKQPVRFAIYDATKLVSYDPNERKCNPSIQAVLKETADAVLVKPASLELRVTELLQGNLSPSEIEARKKQLVEEESVRQKQSCYSSDKHTRKMVETIRSVVYEVMGNNADITVDSADVYSGLDKIKRAGIDVTQQIKNHFETPDKPLSLKKRPEPTEVAIGFFSLEKLRESSPSLKKIHEDAIDNMAKFLAVARVDLTEYKGADAFGLTGDQLSAFKQQAMDHMMASQKVAGEIRDNERTEVNRILQLAAATVARDKNLDILVNMDGVAVKPEFESKAMVGVNDEILGAVAAVSSAPTSK